MRCKGNKGGPINLPTQSALARCALPNWRPHLTPHSRLVTVRSEGHRSGEDTGHSNLIAEHDCRRETVVELAEGRRRFALRRNVKDTGGPRGG